MPFEKGHKKVPGSGRRMGQANRLTTDARQAIEEAFEQLGGVPALVEFARGNPEAFYRGVWPKILPKEIRAEVSLSLEKLLSDMKDETKT